MWSSAPYLFHFQLCALPECVCLPLQYWGTEHTCRKKVSGEGVVYHRGNRDKHWLFGDSKTFKFYLFFCCCRLLEITVCFFMRGEGGAQQQKQKKNAKQWEEKDRQDEERRMVLISVVNPQISTELFFLVLKRLSFLAGGRKHVWGRKRDFHSTAELFKAKPVFYFKWCLLPENHMREQFHPNLLYSCWPRAIWLKWRDYCHTRHLQIIKWNNSRCTELDPEQEERGPRKMPSMQHTFVYLARTGFKWSTGVVWTIGTYTEKYVHT